MSDWFIKLRFINRGQSIIITCLFFALLFFVYIGISIGSFDISLYEYFFGNTNELKNKVFEQIRLPRVILAGLVGASLAISGASLQGLFRNPLADPGLIGVSAGAALGATLIIVLGSSFVQQVFLRQ